MRTRGQDLRRETPAASYSVMASSASFVTIEHSRMGVPRIKHIRPNRLLARVALFLPLPGSILITGPRSSSRLIDCPGSELHPAWPRYPGNPPAVCQSPCRGSCTRAVRKHAQPGASGATRRRHSPPVFSLLGHAAWYNAMEHGNFGRSVAPWRCPARRCKMPLALVVRRTDPPRDTRARRRLIAKASAPSAAVASVNWNAQGRLTEEPHRELVPRAGRDTNLGPTCPNLNFSRHTYPPTSTLISPLPLSTVLLCRFTIPALSFQRRETEMPRPDTRYSIASCPKDEQSARANTLVTTAIRRGTTHPYHLGPGTPMPLRRQSPLRRHHPSTSVSCAQAELDAR